MVVDRSRLIAHRIKACIPPGPAPADPPSGAKHVACFATINPIDEKRTFTKYLAPAECRPHSRRTRPIAVPTSSFILFAALDSIQINSETELDAFHRSIALLAVREAFQASGGARQSLCKIMTSARRTVGESDVGDVVPARVRVRGCEEILSDR